MKNLPFSTYGVVIAVGPQHSTFNVCVSQDSTLHHVQWGGVINKFFCERFAFEYSFILETPLPYNPAYATGWGRAYKSYHTDTTATGETVMMEWGRVASHLSYPSSRCFSPLLVIPMSPRQRHSLMHWSQNTNDQASQHLWFVCNAQQRALLDICGNKHLPIFHKFVSCATTCHPL